MIKRDVKEQNQTRESAYGNLKNVVIENHKLLGRVAEGLVFEDEKGNCIVVKVIAKGTQFDGEFEVDDYEQIQAKKAEELAKKKEKGKKDKAKKEKAKEEEVKE